MFGNQRRVILYGVSLLLEGVRASLKNCRDLEICVLDPSQENPIEIIQKLCPAVFIFDLNSVQSKFQLSLFQYPDLLLVGIDSETLTAQVWSGRQESARDSADLLQVILS